MKRILLILSVWTILFGLMIIKTSLAQNAVRLPTVNKAENKAIQEITKAIYSYGWLELKEEKQTSFWITIR